MEIVQEPESTIVRDATIHRFEYTFDLSWKAVKSWLFQVHGIICNSPKSCIREAFSFQLMNESDTEIFLQMVEDRNLTTHVYMEEIADNVFRHIKKTYISQLEKLAKQLEIQAG